MADHHDVAPLPYESGIVPCADAGAGAGAAGKPVKPILKHSEHKAVPGGIRWDEPNLEYNENNKTATMKITEAPTPYNHEYYTQDQDDEMDDVHEDGAPPRSPQSPRQHIDIQEHFNQVHDAVSAHQESGAPPVAHVDHSMDEGDDPEVAAEKHRKFVAMRSNHYSMKAALANRRMDDDDDDDDDDA